MARQLGEFEQFLLFAVLDLGEGAYGVAIRQRVERRTGRTVSPGAVYTTLERLESKRLVESWMGDQTPARGGRRKRYYKICPEGARLLLDSYRALASMADGLVPLLELAAHGGAGGVAR